MPTSTAEERVAVLLNLLGTDVADSVLEQFRPDKRQQLRQCLKQFDASPPPSGTIDRIVSEFERFSQFAAQAADGSGSHSRTTKKVARAAGDVAEPEPFECTDDPLEDLSRLEPFQIAAALQNESPRTIAMVVDCLDSQMAADALGALPDEMRSDVFLKLNADLQPPAELLRSIVATTVRKACILNPEAATSDESDNSQKIAEMLRSMERTQRNEMLEALEQADAEAAEKVKDLLYVFEDLLLIEDRSLQRLLTEVDSRTLATGLKDGDPAVIDKVMRNFSKRARAALNEEMEYMGALKEEEQLEARKEIVGVIARLDQTGELVMES